jgi:hypothetical protein
MAGEGAKTEAETQTPRERHECLLGVEDNLVYWRTAPMMGLLDKSVMHAGQFDKLW